MLSWAVFMSRRRCRAILCLDALRLDLSGWRWNQGFPSYFSGGTGGTQAANQAAKWSSFPYLSTFQAGRQHFYIFFLPDRFTYFQHRIPIGFILFAFSRSRPKKFRRHVVVTASGMDLGTAGGVLGGVFCHLFLSYFDLGGKAEFLAKSL